MDKDKIISKITSIIDELLIIQNELEKDSILNENSKETFFKETSSIKTPMPSTTKEEIKRIKDTYSSYDNVGGLPNIEF